MDLFQLVEDSRLLNFTSGSEIQRHGIFTVNDKNEIVKRTTYDNKDNVYKTVSKPIAGNSIGPVYNSFDQIAIEKELFNLVVFTENNNFKVALYTDSEHKVTFTQTFIVAPMLIYVADNDSYYLISQTKQDVIEWYELSTTELKVHEDYRIEGKNLYKYHSSGIVDLYSNLKSVLALETEKNNAKYLSIYNFEAEGGIFYINEYFLGMTTSPLQFLQNTELKCAIDVWWTRKTADGTTEVVCLKNKIAPFDLLQNVTSSYAADSFVARYRVPAKPIDHIFEAETVVCTTETPNKVEAFGNRRYVRFHVADIATDGTFHFFFINNQNKIEIKQMKKKYSLEKDDTKIFEDFLGADINNNILSVASLDIGNNGKQSLIISSKDSSTGNFKTHLVKFTIQLNNNKIELMSNFNANTNHVKFVPGASYFIGLNNGGDRMIFIQSPQTSYPSLQQKGIFIGVGTTHFFLTFLYAGLPFSAFKEHVHDCPASIFPTTITVFTFEPNAMYYACFFTSPHLHLITIILFVMLLLAFALIIYLTFQERKKYQIKTRNDNIQKFMKMV